jgi:hypothetical protein
LEHFYISFLVALRFSFSHRSGVGFCLSFRSAESGRSTAQHSAEENISRRLRVYCEPAQRYIKAYIETRQTKRAPTERSRRFCTSAIDFSVRSYQQYPRSGLPRRSHRQRKSAALQFILSSLRLFFSFTSKHIKITSSIDSIQSQTVTVEFEKEAKNIWSQKLMEKLFVCRRREALRPFSGGCMRCLSAPHRKRFEFSLLDCLAASFFESHLAERSF